MSNYDIKVDLSPYLPDTYLKEKIYQSMDKVDYTTYIGLNSTIFVFNINCPSNEYQYYNDPGYLLYGIKKRYQQIRQYILIIKYLQHIILIFH